jgi:hypothetical protein
VHGCEGCAGSSFFQKIKAVIPFSSRSLAVACATIFQKTLKPGEHAEIFSSVAQKVSESFSMCGWARISSKFIYHGLLQRTFQQCENDAFPQYPKDRLEIRKLKSVPAPGRTLRLQWHITDNIGDAFDRLLIGGG